MYFNQKFIQKIESKAYLFSVRNANLFIQTK